jgi:hypothetical protein
VATTLLDMVQELLSDANGDEISSISDTTEAMQAARVVASVYEDVVTEYDIQSVKQLFRLDGLSDVTKPTHMRIPADYHSVEWVKYDTRLDVGADPSFTDICYVYPKDFADMVNRRSVSAAEVIAVTDPSGVVLNVVNNKSPQYYTLFDNQHVVFDSFDATLESTLQQSKTQAYGQKIPGLVLANTTVIQLPTELMSFLKNEVRNTYFDLHAGGATASTQRRATRSRVRLQRVRHTMRNNREQFKHTGPDYGRRPR